MNRGQMKLGLGAILAVFIGLITALVLYEAVIPFIVTGTAESASVNVTYTVPADGEVIDLTGQELLNTPTVTMRDNASAVAAGNYTIDEGVSTSTGLKSIRYTASGSEFAGQAVNITYTYGADGYIDSAGGRSMALLIPILGGLAIAIIALSLSAGGLKNLMGK